LSGLIVLKSITKYVSPILENCKEELNRVKGKPDAHRYRLDNIKGMDHARTGILVVCIIHARRR